MQWFNLTGFMVDRKYVLILRSWERDCSETALVTDVANVTTNYFTKQDLSYKESDFGIGYKCGGYGYKMYCMATKGAIMIYGYRASEIFHSMNIHNFSIF